MKFNFTFDDWARRELLENDDRALAQAAWNAALAEAIIAVCQGCDSAKSLPLINQIEKLKGTEFFVRKMSSEAIEEEF